MRKPHCASAGNLVKRSLIGRSVDRQRRRFIVMVAAGAMTPLAGTSRAAPAASMPIKAVAFDAFPIFDQRSIFAAVKQRLPEQGEALSKLWFAKLFPYTWFRTTARQYVGFEVVAAQAFDAAAATLGIATTAANRDALVAAFSQMELWPDVVERLGKFQRRGLRLAFLSNLSEAVLRANMRRTGIEHFFQATLSTDGVRAFKPAPEAYRLGVEAFGLRKEEIAFAAFAAWDAAGASWFGYPARMGQSPRSAGRDIRCAANRRRSRPGGTKRFAPSVRLSRRMLS
jgi:2-haloacid dehalogenase